MKDSSNKIRGVLFLLILFLLIIPFIQNKFEFIKLLPLNGAIAQPEKKYFSIKDWFSGEYQPQEEKYLNETFGFKNLFIRINNQIAFSLFDKAKANGVIIGKNNYLYEENYIKAYFGTDFIGVDSITKRMQHLKFIQDTLTKLNKTIVVVFAAGKGSYYPEYFPNKFITEKGRTNYEFHLQLAKEYGLNYIDFNKYFIENKNKSKYPLYPQYGIHWSYYGMCLAADSMIRYIEKIRNIDMPNLYWNDIVLADAKDTDYDVGEGMNLLFKLNSNKMAYPQVQVQSETGKTKPSVLVVADSYYWGMFNFGFTGAFSTNHFWYYNKQIYPEYYQNSLETSQVNLRDEIRNHDVIIIMATEATLPGFGWGFIEKTYDVFKGTKNKSTFDAEFQTKLINLRNYIKTDKNWMELIAKKAVINKVSLDSMITLDAIWQIQHENN
jgi:hypothetical protein